MIIYLELLDYEQDKLLMEFTSFMLPNIISIIYVILQSASQREVTHTPTKNLETQRNILRHYHRESSVV